MASLKAEPGKDLLLMGGAEPAAELTARGTARLGLEPAGSRTFDGRVVLLRDRRA